MKQYLVWINNIIKIYDDYEQAKQFYDKVTNYNFQIIAILAEIQTTSLGDKYIHEVLECR